MSDSITASQSTVRRWIEKVADATGRSVTRSHAEELALTIRQVGEGGVVGAVLGAVDSMVGLDVTDSDIPIDLVLAALGTGGAMYYARDNFGDDLRNIGSHSLAIFSFRSTKKLLATMKGDEGEAIAAGENGETTSDLGEEDPVVRAAREL